MPPGCRRFHSAGAGRRGHAPYGVADVVGHEQTAVAVDGYADGAPFRLAVAGQESGEHVERHPGGAPVLEGHEDDLVAAERIAIPGAVLPDEHALRELRGHAWHASVRETE